MKDFDRGRKFGGGGRSFDKRGGRSFGGRDERPDMHRATCSECGKSCEVPFKPTGDKPVYCSDCFKNVGGGDSRRSERSDRRSFDRPSFGGEKRMFTATCSKCGEKCEVPFRPTGEKPVYCSQCFAKGDNAPTNKNTGSSSSNVSKEQFEMLNSKLDRILKALNLSVTTEATPKKETAKVELTKIEAVTKKAPAKIISKTNKIAEPKKTTAKPVKKAAPAKKPAAAKTTKKVAKKK